MRFSADRKSKDPNWFRNFPFHKSAWRFSNYVVPFSCTTVSLCIAQPRDQLPLQCKRSAPQIQTSWTLPPAPTPDSPEIVLTASYSMDDGRYANNGWLQELPDP